MYCSLKCSPIPLFLTDQEFWIVDLKELYYEVTYLGLETEVELVHLK